MRHRSAAALLLTALTALFVGQAAGAHPSHGYKNAVFVQTNETTGNRIAVYDRAEGRDALARRQLRDGRARRRGAARRRIAITSRRRARSSTTASTSCCSR